MTACHLIADGNLTFLCNVNSYGLIYSRRKLVAVFSCEDFGIHNDTVSAVGNLQGGISYLAGLLTEDSS